MKVLVFYRPNSEHARAVEEFLHDLQRQHDVDERHLTIYNVDSREGSSMASLYDIMAYPTFMVVGDDGGFVKGWDSGNLPMMDEIVSYTFTF
jgi:thiol-disulfide isomerase/thioredoxin